MCNTIRLPLKNTFNVRDMGGYPINENKITKWGVFFRSGDIAPNSYDIGLLYKYGVRTVINLKQDNESYESPIKNDKRFNYLHIPLVTDFNKFSGSMYLAILTIFSDQVKEVFDNMSEYVKHGGILFHCASGKDRTGVIAALLLSLLGVSELDIITNYIVSAIYLRPYAKVINKPIDTIQSHSSQIEDEVLEYIRKNYGNTVSYLKYIGISDKNLSDIYNAFCYEQ